MSDDQNRILNERRRAISTLLAGSISLPLVAGCDGSAKDDEVESNALLWAVAWKQTAAEYQALCHQAYNLARLRVDAALANRDADGKPLAVITDMDDTILHAENYWGHLINEDKEFFDDAIWDEWLPRNLATPVPGALEFFHYCHAYGVEVFYITNRNQGDATYDIALNQLKHFGFPFTDEAHLTVYRDTSDKSPARDAIRDSHEVVVLLGDNLNDYKRDYYVKNVEERMALAERDRAEFGDIFILLPNPTDGHWVRAIFGESEPDPTNANRNVLRDAATRSAWDGK